MHHSKIVKAWVADRQDQIELFYLPAIAHNSIQRSASTLISSKRWESMSLFAPKLRDATSAHMMMLEQNPERVMSYFQDRRVKYAA